MQINLKDGQPRKKGELAVEVRKKGNLVEIGAVGYGEAAAAPGQGFPIVLEYYDGKLVLRVWSNINSEDPTHTIDMQGALESKFIQNLDGAALEAAATGLADDLADDPGALVDDDITQENVDAFINKHSDPTAEEAESFIEACGDEEDLTGDLIESQDGPDAFPDTLEEATALEVAPDPQVDLKAARAAAGASIGRTVGRPVPLAPGKK